jgi:hypothetical protein
MLPIEKLEAVARRFSEVEHMLCSPDVLSDRHKLQQLNKERSEIEPVIAAFNEWRDVDRRIKEDREALKDPDLRALAEEELPSLEKQAQKLEDNLKVLLFLNVAWIWAARSLRRTRDAFVVSLALTLACYVVLAWMVVYIRELRHMLPFTILVIPLAVAELENALAPSEGG